MDASSGPIMGTKANDVLTVDHSVSFAWLPDPGNSSTEGTLYFDWDTFRFAIRTVAGPSTATGTVTFDVPSSQPFAAAPAADFAFLFTREGGADLNRITFGNQWTWNPATGVLDPAGTGAIWDDVIQVSFTATAANFSAFHLPDGVQVQDLGHWALVPNPIDVAVFGGAGDDTIYGGQGQETLSGDAGDDVIYVGFGDDLAFGGAGDDAIHGGIGTQVLDGGGGRDTIWGGSGAQTLMGDAGADVLHAGIGNETLVGGAGRDVFGFGAAASGQDVIADFRLGQDVLQLAPGFGGLAIARPHDLASHVGADADGAALVHLGGLSITLLGVSASEVTSHLAQVFRIA